MSSSSTSSSAPHSATSTLVLTGLCLSALVLASVALWRATVAFDTADAAAATRESAQATRAEAPPPKDFAAGLKLPPSTPREAALQRRIDDLERKLALVVASSEGELRKTAAMHDAERKQIKRDIKALHREVGALVSSASKPIAPMADGGVAAAPDAGSEEEEEDGEETADAGASEPEEEPAPKPDYVKREELLSTVQEQAIKAGMKELAAFAGLSDDEADEVEQVLRARGVAHQQVIADVTARRLSVRDASIRLEQINDDARKALRRTLTQEQLQRFQDTISRLDALRWRF